ncbi:MAG: deoxynucleoside kinase [Chitinophagales bacterium]|nr:deoxynucleoside kinase [Chitinophagales bacterium]
MRYNFITIEGTIGAGKTTLANMLAKEFNAKLILEEFENNPFLPKFYEDKARYGFPVELYFMAERFQHLKKLLSEADIFKTFTIADFLFQKSLIFAQQNLSDDEEKLYRMLFDIINPSLPKPDLILYLYAPVEKLLENIKKRGRSYEQHIEPEYLDKIQSAYLSYFKTLTNQPIVLLNCSQLNWVDNTTHYRQVVELLHTPFEPGVHYL